MNLLKNLLFTILLITNIKDAIGDCTNFVDSAGNTYNLQALANSVGYYVANDQHGGLYWFNLCAPLNCPADQGCTCDNSASICQFAANGNKYNCGIYPGFKISDGNGGPGTGVTFDFDNGTKCGSGTPRGTTLRIACDATNNATSVVGTVQVNSTTCHYVVNVKSNHACPTGNNGGPAIGGYGGVVLQI